MLKKTYRILIETCLAILLLLTSLWFVITQPIWTSKPSYHHTGMTVNPNTLRAFVETLSRDLPPRIAIEDQLLPTVKWIETQLKPYGMTQRQTYEVENESFHNIVLTFGEKTAETIVVGAHYDTSHGLAGADDNASGVAGLIELARLLAQTKNLSTAIELVFYPLEEKPYFRSKNMGSYRHAKRLKTAGRQVKLML